MLKQVLRRFPNADAAYREYRKQRALSRPATKTPQGFWLTGNRAMQSGEFEPTETAVVSNLLQEVDTFVNVGANIGYYCCLALSHGKRVLAFEPHPSNLRILTRNLRRNGWEDSVEVFPMAVGNHSGLVRFYGEGTGASLIKGWAGQASEPIDVPISTLDLLLGNRLQSQKCLVLVDVEGAEFSMLQGALLLLRNEPRPKWLVEISIDEHQPEGVDRNPNLVATFEQFFNEGYQAFTVEENPREVTLDEVRQVASTGQNTLETHNFLFQ